MALTTEFMRMVLWIEGFKRNYTIICISATRWSSIAGANTTVLSNAFVTTFHYDVTCSVHASALQSLVAVMITVTPIALMSTSYLDTRIPYNICNIFFLFSMFTAQIAICLCLLHIRIIYVRILSIQDFWKINLGHDGKRG